MEPIHIRFLRFSAFYSPLLLTMAGGHLREQGLEATSDLVGPGCTTADGIRDGSVQVGQTALAVSFAPWERGEHLPFRHFAMLNDRDGFFLAARGADPATFTWGSLVGKRVLVDHLFQPKAMFEEALRMKGVDPSAVHIVDAGDVTAMERAFRAGEGDVLHLQGPVPQQLEADGLARVVASVGEVVGPVVFSSLCAAPAWLATPQAAAFMRAFRKGCAHAVEASPEEIAALTNGYFPHIAREVLVRTIRDYQRLGCWAGGTEIPRDLYDRTVAIFLRSGTITAPVPMEEVVAPPPGSAA
jgi:NitT/TauT family transport system substrate-binding protein